MSISITKYVDITSSVGAGTFVPVAELIGRLFTTNPLLPTESFAEFTSAEDVGDYFGTASEEYARSVQYFNFINKTGVQPEKISFARWTNADVAPRIFGGPVSTTVLQFAAIADGSLTLTLGGVTNVLTGINLTSVTSFANVAAALQTAINAQSGLQWTAATVTYDSLSGGFNFVGGDAVVANVAVSPTGSGTDLQNLIAWGSTAIFSDGDVTQTITDTLTNSAAASNNFGSFLFMPTLSIDEIVEAATWNYAQNVQFQYYVPVLLVDAATYSAALANIGMVALIISETSGEYPEQGPMQTMASTDYNRQNTTQNYMYQQYNLTPSVLTTALSNTLDAEKVNYNGQTQSAGTQINFFQTGVLMGPTNSPQYMNIGANEQWLKAAMASQLITLLLVLTKISANSQGVSQILAAMQNVINQALLNGTISVGKTLTDAQKAFIQSVTGDPLAYIKIQTVGYIAGCTIDPVTSIAYYSLLYSKDDVVRQIQGTQILI